MATLEASTGRATIAASVPLAEACPSCGTVLVGEFCHVCGERRYAAERFSLRHFLAETVEDVFDLDSRALRTLRILLVRPGELTLEMLKGRRRPYIGALKLYLVVFAVTIFLSLLAPTRSAGNRGSNVAAMFNRLVHALAVRRGTTDAAARAALEQTTAQHISWFSLTIPLLFAAILFAMFRRRRRWYGQHLVFATHFATLNFLAALVILPFQLPVFHLGPGATIVLSAVMLVPLYAWMMIGVRTVYGTGWPGAAGSTLVLFIAFSLCQFVAGMLALGSAALSIYYLGP